MGAGRPIGASLAAARPAGHSGHRTGAHPADPAASPGTGAGRRPVAARLERLRLRRLPGPLVAGDGPLAGDVAVPRRRHLHRRRPARLPAEAPQPPVGAATGRHGWRMLPIWVGPQASCSAYRAPSPAGRGAADRQPVARARAPARPAGHRRARPGARRSGTTSSGSRPAPALPRPRCTSSARGPGRCTAAATGPGSTPA